MINGLLSYFTRHRTAANLLLVILLALGLAAVPRMRAQYFPDVISDEIDVDVTWSGAGAEAVDTAIVSVLEPVLLAVEGVSGIEARSTEGRASIELEFEPGYDMAVAATDVESAVDGISTLPESAEDPEVSWGGWRDRVTDVIITGPVGVDQLGRIADDFVTQLFAAGVTRTSTQGIAAPETVVEVPSMALVQYDLTLSEIADAIGSAADASPAGEVAGTARIRAGQESRSAADIADVVLRSNAAGAPLTVGDVARIVVEGPDRERAYFVGADPAVSIQVQRSEAGDALDIQARVEEVVAQVSPSLPQGVQIDLIRGRAEEISARLDLLVDNGAMGLALVVGLLFLFLNARIAFWVAAGIPVAMTAALALMYAAGLTLNMMSLFALIITLGIVVDDAIVVGEHADFRARRLGESPVTAAETAAQRMFAPVFSATVTTIIAFFGLTAIGGVFGTLIADIPFTVIVVLIASLVECFLILPNHMAHALAHTGERHWYDAPSRVVNRGFTWVRERLFRPAMGLVTLMRYPVIAAAVLLLSLQMVLYVSGKVQWRFFDSPEQGSVSGNFAMQASATRDDTLEQLSLIQGSLDDVRAQYVEEYGADPVVYALAEIGGNAGRALSGTDNLDADQLGAISIELIDPDLRSYSSFEFVAVLQDAVARHPQLQELSFRGWRSGPGGDAIDVRLSGAETQVLKDAAEALKAELAGFGEVSALEDNLAYDTQEFVLDLTPQGEALGFSIAEIGSVLRDRLEGIEAATYPDGIRSAAIRVELPQDEFTADYLDRVVLPTPDGGWAMLRDIVTVEVREGFSTIRRENGVREVSVTGDLDSDDAARAAEIMTIMQERILPTVQEQFGVNWELSGLSEQEDEFLNDALTGFSFCLLGIYLTLAWIFASWTRPVVIMATIPFGLVGAIWGHYIWDVPLSMFSVVGLIGMTGIIINDSIVLVTTTDEYAGTRPSRRAIIDAACDRLRPVLLTTLTTVLGLAPLLYERSSQAQFLKPTVITLVYGLGFGMVLVLVVVPALLAIQGDVGQAASSLRRALSTRAKGARLGIVGAGLAMAAVFAATIGAWMVTGTLPFGLSGGAAVAFGLFALGSFVVALAVASLGAFAFRAPRA
ncbi:Multidrug efflux pump subunit AcrB [Palleronia marisminoris]|uniref:Multidrug efflux pump subunit AcrB n=1 Tax=Palleronia marisminoris TaxID=315423 RepID=A0A1Y5SSV9_9RHOB|nr:efflux RND transporter permease subunit [Palleronia marisminoris]SFG96993.1 Multidrug efflux pump subunit AcrB [Palleronia marisminoris]SLN47541.1 Multidrug efflux pump subunit AcrB [Palleronia marisminoris]